MLRKETSSSKEPTGQLVHRLVKEIGGSGVGDISNIAGIIQEKMERGDLNIAVGSSKMQIPTDFDFLETNGPRPEYIPTIVVNPEELILENKNKIKRDLARTLVVAHTFYSSPIIYGARLREIYRYGCEAQGEWLKQNRADYIRLDPRRTNREALSVALLGEDRYMSDMGFGDWTIAIEEYYQRGVDKNTFHILKGLSNARNFIRLRKQYGIDIYKKIVEQRGEGFGKLNPDERAEQIVNRLLVSAVYQRVGTLNHEQN